MIVQKYGMSFGFLGYALLSVPALWSVALLSRACASKAAADKMIEGEVTVATHAAIDQKLHMPGDQDQAGCPVTRQGHDAAEALARSSQHAAHTPGSQTLAFEASRAGSYTSPSFTGPWDPFDAASTPEGSTGAASAHANAPEGTHPAASRQPIPHYDDPSSIPHVQPAEAALPSSQGASMGATASSDSDMLPLPPSAHLLAHKAPTSPAASRHQLHRLAAASSPEPLTPSHLDHAMPQMDHAKPVEIMQGHAEGNMGQEVDDAGQALEAKQQAAPGELTTAMSAMSDLSLHDLDGIADKVRCSAIHCRC